MDIQADSFDLWQRWLRKVVCSPCLSLGVSGSAMLISLAAIFRRSGPLIAFQEDTPAWTQMPWTLFAAILAVYGVLKTLQWNRLQYERQSLDARFVDIINRLSAEQPAVRANACIRLAEMAGVSWPQSESAEVRNRYSFYERAVSQLAAALHLETEPGVRREVVKALTRTAQIGRRIATELQMTQVSEVADANRTAYASFQDALGQYLAWEHRRDPTQNSIDIFKRIISFAQFVIYDDWRRGFGVQCLESISTTPECRDALDRYKFASPDDQSDADRTAEITRLLDMLQKCARSLADSRDALVATLRELPEATPLPIEGTDSKHVADLHLLPLQKCFLAGAYMPEVTMYGADLYRANISTSVLENCDLRYADLMESDLRYSAVGGSDFTGADLYNACLDHWNGTDVTLTGARFEKAYLRYASLERATGHGTDFTRADMVSANLSRADLTDSAFNSSRLRQAVLHQTTLARASLRYTDLVGATLKAADLRESNMEGAKIQGADFQHAIMMDAKVAFVSFRPNEFEKQYPSFEKTEWWYADFTHPLRRQETSFLDWLTEVANPPVNVAIKRPPSGFAPLSSRLPTQTPPGQLDEGGQCKGDEIPTEEFT